MARGLPAIVGLVCFAVVASAEPRGWSGPQVFLSAQVLETHSALVRELKQIPRPPYWNPTKADAARADTLLFGRVDPKRHTYGRQYFGAYREEVKVLYVRGFCPRFWETYDDPWWERSVIELLDTGSCVFGAELDLERGQILSFGWGTVGP